MRFVDTPSLGDIVACLSGGGFGTAAPHVGLGGLPLVVLSSNRQQMDGIELGLHQAGHRSALLYEIEPGAAHVLKTRFPEVPLVGDVRSITKLPKVQIVAAGFPCQDLSQAGRTAGIGGRQSGLVGG